MLKYSFLGFLGLLACNTLAAQTPLSVYFSPNQHQLQKADIARLDSLTKTLPADGIWRLEIKAYTDDRGSAETNKQLAERRAQAVNAYFSKYKPSIGESKIDPIGEVAIAALADNQLEAQRQQARRVDIYIQTAAKTNTFSAANKYKNVDDFWQQLRAKSEINQNFVHENPAQPFTIYGKKGSHLEIPQDAFVVKVSKGKPKAPISFELREAYTFGDMILQGLTTTSDSNLLQTGGMIYINAKDADGQDLELAPNKTIGWTFPSTEALPKDMQVFTAHHNTPHTDQQATGINWQANPQQFASRPPNPRFNNRGDADLTTEEIHLASLTYLKMPIPTWSVEPSRVREITNYKRLSTPILDAPLLEDSTLISRAVMQKYPKKSTESDLQYQARIMKLHRTSQETYDYATEQLGFMLTEEIFEKIEIRFSGLEKFISPTTPLWHLKNVVITYQLDSFSGKIKELEQSASNLLKNDLSTKYAIGVANACQEAQLQATQEELLEELLDVCTIYTTDGTKKYQFIHDKVLRWYLKKYPSQPHNLVALSKELNKIFNNQLFWQSTALAQENYNAICRGRATNQFANLNEHFKAQENLRRYIFSQDFVKKRAERAEQEHKLNQAFANTANLNGLGWVNCDRFAGYKDLIHFNIPMEVKLTSQFYLIIPTEKVVVRLETNFDGVRSPKAYSGLPASKKALLIGLRLNGDVIEICEHESLISELSKATLTFLPSNEKSIESTLTRL